MLGESYNIKQNLEWERLRYLSTLIHNVNVSKKKDMIKPTKLFPLPQDIYLKKKEVEILAPEKVQEIAARFAKREKAKNP